MKNKWYQQGPVWLIILLPVAAVIASITTVFIAYNNKIDLVVDDYYKTGKAINADMSKFEQAVKLGIILTLTLDGPTGLVSVIDGQHQPAQALVLNFYHPTQADHDFSLALTANDAGDYPFELTQATLQGGWTVRIEPVDSSWRVQQKINFPTDKVILDGQQ